MENEWQYIREKETERERAALRFLSETCGEDPFYLVNLALLRAKFSQWSEYLPRVDPFYAVKCNPDEKLLGTLQNLGCGFDCASVNEMKDSIAQGAKPERIIYANPCKSPSHLEEAKKLGVRLMTFDNHAELTKVATLMPEAELVLRILVDDSNSICRMGNKYGAQLEEVPSLLELAKKLNLNVVGVSYHVGSGCLDVDSFVKAVKAARVAFDLGCQYGFNFRMLDVGGGFPGQFLPSDKTYGVSFASIASTLGIALNHYFPEDSDVHIIGEPGRFFATSTHILATNIIGRREPHKLNPSLDLKTGKLASQPGPGYMYYVNDGLYGSFNCVLYDHVELSKTNRPFVLSKNPSEYNECSIWGPTCDGLDCVMKKAELPLLEIGDWIYFGDMGAYTGAAASSFNGFNQAKVHYLD
eukprot:CAMPEP_0167760454 /NCGR_PEP_ID=MMETSP0110_2-20121227/11599_1 /TAXON_ID=629695 /ORGANISM="Gymnochlora sp., Strain CCMP2014" /LENGTH=412 /DNA_ID=CAMNT_0007646975 /DNA_START=284 /DNA_END=1522 /DNA_ORIENTATION=+